ncbi:MAG: 4Fe-4S binding protein [Eubacteriales bacterium]
MKRRLIQILSAVATNSYIQGFLQSTIYQGKAKIVCVPGLNCYSCPGAIGACPIGSLQGSLSRRGQNYSLYVLGFLLAFGIAFGRFICGFLCPFGFLQDLLYKIKTKKMKIKENIDRQMRYLKYVILVVFVILLPIFLVGDYGVSSPYFCKLICPAGTLEAGIPLVAGNEDLQQLTGWLFNWKVFVLVAVIIMSILVYRFFCKYMCPLGAIYGLFNRISFYGLDYDKEKCIHCMACHKACNMQVKVTEQPNSAECIRCGDCKNVCPTNAIELRFRK